MELKLKISTYTKFCIGLILLRLFLASDMTIFAIPDAGHDDGHFLHEGILIYKLKWLGDYNQYTLIKGPFYSMFLALNHYIGLPLQLSQLLLYIAGCALLVSVVREITRNNYLSGILLFILLFNPVFYSDNSTRIIREAIYPALALLTLFAYAKLFLSYKKEGNYFRYWIVISGSCFAAFWLTKEDGIWILPAMFFLLLFFGYLLYKENKPIKKSLFVMVSPFLIAYFFVNSICGINMFKYGIYEVTEFSDGDFKDAYGALSRVKQDTIKPYIPVNKSTRSILYKTIPAFHELEKGEHVFDSWAGANPFCKEYPTTCGEVAGGWFMWALRDAVAFKGYYENPQKAKSYYKRLSNEINEACDSKKLDCYPPRSGFVPRLEKEDYIRTAEHFGKGWITLANLTDYTANKSSSLGNEEGRYLFRVFTRNHLREDFTLFENNMGNRKLKVLKLPFFIYSKLVLPLGLLSLLVVLVISVKLVVFRKLPTLLHGIIIALFISAVCRMVILALVDSTSFRALNNLYMSPVYPLVYAFIVLCMYELMQLIKGVKFSGLTYNRTIKK